MEKISAYSNMVNMRKLAMFNSLGLVLPTSNEKTKPASTAVTPERRSRNDRRAGDKKNTG